MNEVLAFLKDLRKNNTREWFQANRSRYEESFGYMKGLWADLGNELSQFDHIDETKGRVYRIYRDVRFSKDKTPYKSSWSMSFTRAGADRRGGYYLRISPGNKSLLATGFWGPEPADLLHIRKQISQDPELLQDALSDNKLKSYFGEMIGDAVKTSPKGFDKNDPAISLLRHKQFILSHPFSDREVVDEQFVENVAQGFKKAGPFLTAMTEMLTTDLNGTSIL